MQTSTHHAETMPSNARQTEMSCPETTPQNGLVREAPAFCARDVLDLADGKILAIHIRNFYTSTAAKALGRKFLASRMLSGYEAGKNTNEVLKIGMSLFECTDPEKERQYFAQASAMLETMRTIASPTVLPVDKARLALDEAWPYGCGLMNLDAPGRKCFAGLVRAFSDGGGARPHNDRCDWDMPGSADARAVLCQLACNVYLQKPEGGELELWNIHPSKELFEALRVPGDYGLDRSRLPAPDVVINPAPGDLVCFNASKVHAVRASRGGIRIAQSWFIAFCGARRPLALFS